MLKNGGCGCINVQYLDFFFLNPTSKNELIVLLQDSFKFYMTNQKTRSNAGYFG